ncbi:MAG: HAMP domain-containing histidine kinase [Lentimicrobiaceae bacterium]|nr:HAMP domain-containing histidine kinase [Lentimicrobiaceae bacterium]
MKLSTKHKLFFYIFLIFALFITGILVANQLTLYFTIALFLVMLLLIHLVIESFEKSVRQFRDHKYRQEITGNIAHELRTPVTSIRGYLETVLETQLDPEKEHYFINQAYNQTIVLSELIRDMGLITKIEDAPSKFQITSVCINQLLIELKADLQLVLQEKGVEMEWDIPENLVIQGNQNLLYSIFRNLADNALRYAGEHIKIEITGNQDKQYCYFSFSDNGVGILDETHLDRLFERFYRINEGRTRDSGGSGLGLSIVKNAITFHKGFICAKNREGGGLEFLFSLKTDISRV